MEGVPETVRAANGIIYYPDRRNYICELCKTSKTKALKTIHLTDDLHLAKVQVFNSVFVTLENQPFCQCCNKKIEWTNVQNHAEFHKILPFWEPEDIQERFYVNYLSRMGILYYCHLCDQVLKNWFRAWTHLDDERHLKLVKEVEKHELDKGWDVHCPERIAHGIVPGPESRIDCRICEVTMDPSEAEGHIRERSHMGRRSLRRDDLLRRVKTEELAETSGLLQTSSSSKQITPKFPNRPMICNFSIEPDSAMTSTLLKSERVESSHEIQPNDHIPMNSLGTDLKSSSKKRRVRNVGSERAQFESLVLNTSWVTKTKHQQFKQLFAKKYRKEWPADAATESLFCLLCFTNFSSTESARKHTASREHADSLKKYGTEYIIIMQRGSLYCKCCYKMRKHLAKMRSHMATNQHLATVRKLNQEKKPEPENKSSENVTNDDVKSEPRSEDSNQCSTSSSSSYEEEPKPPGDDSDDNSEPKYPSSSEFSTISPGPPTELGISNAGKMKVENLDCSEINSNWIFRTTEELFGQLVSAELREILAINVKTHSCCCVICFEGFLCIESALEHISDQHHVNSRKMYGCDFIVMSETEGYHCTCCDWWEQKLDQIYNHLLSSSHAEQLIIYNQQIDDHIVSLQEESESSEITTNDNGVSQPFRAETEQSSISPSPSCEKPELSRKNSRDNSEPGDQFSLKSYTTNPGSSSELKTCHAPESKEGISESLAKDLIWIIGMFDPLYKKNVPKKVRKLLAQTAGKKLLYCLACLECLSDNETAEEHISGERHSNFMKKYGCDSIVMTETDHYYCKCCKKQIGKLQQIYHHVITSGHTRQFREYERQNSAKPVMVDAANGSNAIGTNASGIPQQIRGKSTPSCDQSKSSSENSQDSGEPKDQLSSSVCPIASGSSSERKTCREGKRKDGHVEFLENDLNWVIRVSDPTYKRVVPNNLRKESADHTEGQFFCCLICLNHLSNIETATNHLTCKKHAKSIKRYGCECIIRTETGGYCCTCCNRQKNSLESIHNHLMSQGHANQLNVDNPQHRGQSVFAQAANKSSRIRTSNSSDSHSFSEDLKTFSTNSLSSRDNSCDNKQLNSEFSKNLPKIKPGQSPDPVDNESDKNFAFVGKDLDWVVGFTHPLYPKWRIKSIEKELAKNSTKSYCLICCSFFCRLQTAKGHIANNVHKNSLKQHGCHYIEATPQSQYRCTCCSSKNMNFNKICSHVTSEGHIQKVGKSYETESETISKKGPNETEANSCSSVDMPASKRSLHSKIPPAVSNISENFGFRETDLNWVVSRAHSSCKKLFLSRQEKSVENTSKQSFYCFICDYGELVDSDTARKHISSKSHAMSVELHGCECIELTSDFKYHCTCCNRHKDSFLKILSHVMSDGHRVKFRRMKNATNKRPDVDHAGNESSEVEINNAIPEQRFDGDSMASSIEMPPIDELSGDKIDSNNAFSSNVISIDSQPSLVPEILPAAEKTAVNYDILVTDFPWITEITDATFKKLNVQKLDESLSNNAVSGRFHCRICNLVFPNAEIAENHASGEQHANSMKKYGCHYLAMTSGQKYLCRCCNRQKESFPCICDHLMSDGHRDKFRRLENATNNRPDVDHAGNESSEVEINNAIPEQRFDGDSMASSIEMPPIDELSGDKIDSNNAFSSNVISIDSQPSLVPEILPAAEKTAVNYDILVTDFPWITEITDATFKKLNVQKLDESLSNNAVSQWFHCRICNLVFPNAEIARNHASGEQHGNSMEKYGCHHLAMTSRRKYLCRCCNRQKKSFPRICAHLKSETHLERLRQFNQDNDEPAIIAHAEDKSTEVTTNNSTVEQPIGENSNRFSTSAPLIEETPQEESESNNSISSDFPKTDLQPSLDPKSCPAFKKRAANLDFFARDLDWVIDSFHKLFPERTVKKPNRKLCSNTEDQLFHCLVCFTDFPSALETKNHIFSEQHRNSVQQYGCHLVQVTRNLNYRCACCNYETKTFLDIHQHVMNVNHAKILGAFNRQSSTVVSAESESGEIKSNANKVGPQFSGNGTFSFDWPAPSENYTPSYQKPQPSRTDSPANSESNDWFSQNFPKINSAPPKRRPVEKTSEPFEFLEEDLNWVVGSSHTLYKMKASKTLCVKSAGNVREQCFYCLICCVHVGGIETAVMHISSEEHADSIKQLGCHFIKVTPESKYHCACCNRQKKRFYQIFDHIMSVAHMDRLCEINRETEEQSAVKLVEKDSTDFESHDNSVGQSFSENSESYSTNWPPSSEKSVTTIADTSSFCEASTSSFEATSCIFVTKRNAKKSYCYICENSEIPIATKNVENHISSMRHKFSLKRHGCDNIETRKNGSYYCACCECEISHVQNVYLHVKDKKHMSSLIKVKQESRRIKKVSRTTSVENRCKTTGKPLLSEFIVKKITEPADMVDDDLYESVESSHPYDNLRKYSGNVQNDMEKCNVISHQLDNLKQPLLNSMLITMADDLSRLSNQIEEINKSTSRGKNSSNRVKYLVEKNRFSFKELVRCQWCKVKVTTPTDLHSHMAKHISEELVSMKNSQRRNKSFNESAIGSDDRPMELADLENLESVNQSTNPHSNRSTNPNIDPQSFLSLDDSTDSLKSDRSLSQFSDFSSMGSDSEFGDSINEENVHMPEWDREQYLKNAMKQSMNAKKIDVKEVLAHLNFKRNHIYDLEDKLNDLQLGSRLALIIDKETIYCLVCRVRVNNTLKDYHTHLWSLDHCNYLDVMENDAEAFAEFPHQFSDLDLAHEYMEEISSSTVRCYLCNKDLENDNEVLRDHIYENEHERACALTRSNASTIFETMKESVKCNWYGIEHYSCFACSFFAKSEVTFVKHLNSRKHTKKILKWPNFERKMMFDCCLSCAVLWYGYRSSYFYHVNQVGTHEWLSNDGFYLVHDLRKSAKILLQQPENYADQAICHLDEIRADENSKGEALVNDLERIVRPTFPRAKAHIFGSRVTRLNSEDSDIDIFLDCSNVYDGTGKPDTLYFIDNVHKCLTKNPECWDLHEVLTNCRSPIIRAYHRPTGLACDISFDNGLTVEKTKFIKRIVDVYPTFRKLVVILKMWMAYCDLGGSERISHNSLYWLVIFFLQNETILPSIAALISMKNKSKIIAGCEVGVSYDFDYWEPDGDTSVKELLQRFFAFYANFDFRFDVACPLLGGAIKKRDFVYPDKLPKEMKMYVKYVKRSKKVEMFRIDSPMCVQDPFDLPHNVTKAVRKYVLTRFRTCCLKSLDFMASS